MDNIINNQIDWENYNWPLFLKIVHYDLKNVKFNKKLFIFQNIYFYFFLLIVIDDIIIHVILMLLKFESINFIIVILLDLMLILIACIWLILPFRGLFYNFNLIRYYIILQVFVWVSFIIYIIINHKSLVQNLVVERNLLNILYFIHFICLLIYLVFSFLGFTFYVLILNLNKIKFYNYYK